MEMPRRPIPMARNRSRVGHRCESCQMHRTLCICALIPAIRTRTRVVLVIHQLETRKPTNTGRLAARCLVGSQVVVRGADLPEKAAEAWAGAAHPVLLFPHPD